MAKKEKELPEPLAPDLGRFGPKGGGVWGQIFLTLADGRWHPTQEIAPNEYARRILHEKQDVEALADLQDWVVSRRDPLNKSRNLWRLKYFDIDPPNGKDLEVPPWFRQEFPSAHDVYPQNEPGWQYPRSRVWTRITGHLEGKPFRKLPPPPDDWLEEEVRAWLADCSAFQQSARQTREHNTFGKWGWASAAQLLVAWQGSDHSGLLSASRTYLGHERSQGPQFYFLPELTALTRGGWRWLPDVLLQVSQNLGDLAATIPKGIPFGPDKEARQQLITHAAGARRSAAFGDENTTVLML